MLSLQKKKKKKTAKDQKCQKGNPLMKYTSRPALMPFKMDSLIQWGFLFAVDFVRYSSLQLISIHLESSEELCNKGIQRDLRDLRDIQESE